MQADAAHVERLAVEDQPAAGDLDRADAAVQRVARDLAAADADGEADVVEVRVCGDHSCGLAMRSVSVNAAIPPAPIVLRAEVERCGRRTCR